MTTGTTTAPTTPSDRTTAASGTASAGTALPLMLIIPTLVLLVAALGYPIGWQVVTSFKQYGLMQQFGAPGPVRRPRQLRRARHRPLPVDRRRAVDRVLRRHRRRHRRHRRRDGRADERPDHLAPHRAPGRPARRLGDARRRRDDRVDLDRRLAPRACSTGPWSRLGVDGAEGHNWLAEPLSFFVVASVIIVWMSVPFVALSIYAGLTQVSTEVLEAASLDGATGIQRLRHIILPIIAPVLSIVMLLQLIWDLRVFTQIKLLQDAGGVTNETNLLGTYVYQLGTGKGDFGTASAVSILILVLTIALSWYYVRSLMKEDV